jgi:hypothetical protein
MNPDIKIKIKVKNIEKQVFIFEIEENKTIINLKNMIEDQLDIEKYCQRLLFKGSLLPDEKTFKECNIEENSIIFLIQTMKYI